jgi:hypothetical protein
MGLAPSYIHQGQRNGSSKVARKFSLSLQDPQLMPGGHIDVQAAIAGQGKALSLLSSNMVGPPVICRKHHGLTFDSHF